MLKTEWFSSSNFFFKCFYTGSARFVECFFLFLFDATQWQRVILQLCRQETWTMLNYTPTELELKRNRIVWIPRLIQQSDVFSSQLRTFRFVSKRAWDGQISKEDCVSWPEAKWKLWKRDVQNCVSSYRRKCCFYNNYNFKFLCSREWGVRVLWLASDQWNRLVFVGGCFGSKDGLPPQPPRLHSSSFP